MKKTTDAARIRSAALRGKIHSAAPVARPLAGVKTAPAAAAEVLARGEAVVAKVTTAAARYR